MHPIVLTIDLPPPPMTTNVSGKDAKAYEVKYSQNLEIVEGEIVFSNCFKKNYISLLLNLRSVLVTVCMIQMRKGVQSGKHILLQIYLASFP